MSVKLMTRIDKVKDILKQMTEDERLGLIRSCNLENNKLQIDKVYLQFNNNHHCPHCQSNKICKNDFFTIIHVNTKIYSNLKK